MKLVKHLDLAFWLEMVELGGGFRPLDEVDKMGFPGAYAMVEHGEWLILLGQDECAPWLKRYEIRRGDELVTAFEHDELRDVVEQLDLA